MTLADIIRELRAEVERTRPDVDFDPKSHANRERETLLFRQGKYEGAVSILDSLEQELRHEDIEARAVRR